MKTGTRFILLPLLLMVSSSFAEPDLRLSFLHSLASPPRNFPEVLPSVEDESSSSLHMAIGESEALQLLIEAGETLKDLRLTAGVLLSEEGDSLPANCLSLFVVDRDESLRPVSRQTLKYGNILRLWLEAKIPHGSWPGYYESEITIHSRHGQKSFTLALELLDYEIESAPLRILDRGRAPSLEELILNGEEGERARATHLPPGDIPSLNPRAAAVSARLLPLCAWFSWLSELIVDLPEANTLLARRFQDGLEDLGLLSALEHSRSPLSRPLARSLDCDAARGRSLPSPGWLLQWRRAALDLLSGDDRYAEDFLRRRREAFSGEFHSLLEEEAVSRGWKGGVRETDGVLTLDSSATFRPELRDWRLFEQIEITVEAIKGATELDLVLESKARRGGEWRWKIRLLDKEERVILLRLPRETLDLGNMRGLRLEKAKDGKPVILWDIGLR
ncbi:MAG: hypothetical protein QF492_00690 [Candidatus Krumholzibacteria bacterium]|jgi:hypothetical protein|nr:hypothetical protein [Candidatus Krumholzibacteria bacterium]MDP6668409.1 hypothetical protein [Candidatus Krumholzibacteria bacterium]MDP6797978.1 hypothetical protein [Candidatus Krumholzibacteria bacterium]MDP7021867.1 hypothetical protein [Candidatus Krumholzibacteria bacterium]